MKLNQRSTTILILKAVDDLFVDLQEDIGKKTISNFFAECIIKESMRQSAAITSSEKLKKRMMLIRKARKAFLTKQDKVYQIKRINGMKGVAAREHNKVEFRRKVEALYYEGFSQRQTAERLNTSQNKVFRTLQWLKGKNRV